MLEDQGVTHEIFLDNLDHKYGNSLNLSKIRLLKILMDLLFSLCKEQVLLNLFNAFKIIFLITFGQM